MHTVEFRVLCSLRRIIRAVDIYSRRLNSEFGLTAPQLICLQAVVSAGNITLSKLTAEVSLSPSTVTGIVDRLEMKGLLKRVRSSEDRRKINLVPSVSGMEIVEKSPSLLQDRLSESLSNLPEDEQVQIAESLERVVHLMEVQDVDASPNLIITQVAHK